MKLSHRDGDGQVRDPDGEDQGSKFTAEDGGEIRSRTESLLLEHRPPVYGRQRDDANMEKYHHTHRV